MKNPFVVAIAFVLLASTAPAQDTATVELYVEGLEDSAAAAVQAELDKAKVSGVTASVADEMLTLELAPGAVVSLKQVQKALGAVSKSIEEEALLLEGSFQIVVVTDDEADYTEGLIEGYLEGSTVEAVADAKVDPSEKGAPTVFQVDYTPPEDGSCTYAELVETVGSALITPEADGFKFGVVDLRWTGPSEE